MKRILSSLVLVLIVSINYAQKNNTHVPITAFWWNGGWDHYETDALKYIDELIVFAIAANPETGELLEHPSSTATERVYMKGKTSPGLTTTMLKRLTTDAKKLGVKLTIGFNAMGSKENYFNALVKNNKHEIFAKNILEFSKKWGFTAIDIDYEHVSNDQDKVYLTKIIKALSDSFHPEGLHVTGAFGVQREPVLEWLEANHQYLDQINIMSYVRDPNWIEKRYSHLVDDLGVPKEKLVMGIGFYGKGRDSKKKMHTIYYRDLVKAIDINDESQNEFQYPHAEIKDEKIKLRYNNSNEFLQKKVDLVRKYGYKGVMVWMLNGDISVNDPNRESRIEKLRELTQGE